MLNINTLLYSLPIIEDHTYPDHVLKLVSFHIDFQGVLWNFACVMAMIGLTIIILGLTLVIPAMMKVVPISVIQQSQGRLSLFFIQALCEILTVFVK